MIDFIKYWMGFGMDVGMIMMGVWIVLAIIGITLYLLVGVLGFIWRNWCSLLGIPYQAKWDWQRGDGSERD